MPMLTARVLIAALLRAGFIIVRQKGSHVFLKNLVTKRVTSVPLHAGDLPKGLVGAIIKQAGFTLKQFLKFL